MNAHATCYIATTHFALLEGDAKVDVHHLRRHHVHQYVLRVAVADAQDVARDGARGDAPAVEVQRSD
jgi:hypothetical protein